MGKLSRQRKLKSCDPFYKGVKPAIDDSYDLEPKGDFEKDQEGKRTFMDRQLQKIHRKADKIEGKKGKKNQGNPRMQKQPGETNKKFLHRLDTEVREAIEKTIADTKKVRDKRKKHLKQRDDKIKDAKLKKKNETSMSEFRTDVVKFGDVVNEPPQLKFKPRNAPDKTKTASSLHLTAILRREKSDAAIPRSGTVKRKHMTVGQKAQFDKTRQDIIETYRKKKKMDLQKSVLGKTPGE